MNVIRLKALGQNDFQLIGLDEEGQCWKFVEETEQYSGHWTRLNMGVDAVEKEGWAKNQDAIAAFNERIPKARLAAKIEKDRKDNLTWFGTFKEWLDS